MMRQTVLFVWLFSVACAPSEPATATTALVELPLLMLSEPTLQIGSVA